MTVPFLVDEPPASIPVVLRRMSAGTHLFVVLSSRLTGGAC
jgi:hypothetical protein